MRDLAGDVVNDVGLRDSVGGTGADPAGKLAEEAVATHEVAVKGREGTTGEGEGGGLVMRKSGVGVLEESDQDEPVVDLTAGVSKEISSQSDARLTQR